MSTVTEFPVQSCPGIIRQVADDYGDLLADHYKAFVAMLCGCAFGVGSFSDIFRFFLFSPSVSSLGRLFDDSDNLWQKLNRRHRRRLLRLMPLILTEPNRFMWAIDDTLIPKSGRSIYGTYYWHDHNTKGTVWGHRLMVVGIVDRKRKILIPVYWEILHREDKSEKKTTHEKGWQVALRLLEDSLTEGFPKLLVVADSWFAGEEFFQALERSGFKFGIEVKSNRRVSQHGKNQNLDCSVDEFFADRTKSKIFYHKAKKWASEAILLFKDSKIKLRIVAVSNKRKEAPFAYYATNELSWNAAKVWAASRDRWAIEVQFRELKQLFTLGEVAVQSQQAVETAISVAAIALTMIRLEQLAQANTISESQYVRPIPAGAIVRDLQLKALASSISKICNDPRAIEKIKLRINSENFGRKPTERGKNHIIQTGSGSSRKVA
jgi:hypothetical protein